MLLISEIFLKFLILLIEGLKYTNARIVKKTHVIIQNEA
jgi:hypothetical protein